MKKHIFGHAGKHWVPEVWGCCKGNEYGLDGRRKVRLKKASLGQSNRHFKMYYSNRQSKLKMSVPLRDSRLVEIGMHTKRSAIFLSSSTSSAKLYFIDKLALISFIAKHFIDSFLVSFTLRIAVICKVLAICEVISRDIVWLYSWYGNT